MIFKQTVKQHYVTLSNTKQLAKAITRTKQI